MKDKFEQLRARLESIVEGFDFYDPARGLVGRVKVTGGVLLHPLTRSSINNLLFYGASQNTVKILEPRFLRTLPTLSIDGVENSSQFSAQVAHALGLYLGNLKKLHDMLTGMGIKLDLEKDLLILHGKTKIGAYQLTLIARQPGDLLVTKLQDYNLAGKIRYQERTMTLQGNPGNDLDNLVNLIKSLNEKTQDPYQVAGEQPESPAMSSDIVELTEVVEQTSSLEDQISADSTLPQTTNETLPQSGFQLDLLLDKLGSGAEISANENKLILTVPIRVIQGLYVFKLEQAGDSRFIGVLTTPRSGQHQVSFDMKEISDIKEVLDQVMLK